MQNVRCPYCEAPSVPCRDFDLLWNLELALRGVALLSVAGIVSFVGYFILRLSIVMLAGTP